MELAALGAARVVRDAEMAQSKETSRRRRVSKLALFLAIIAIPLVTRATFGVVRYLQARHLAASGALAQAEAHYLAASADFRIVPSFPSGADRYLPAIVLIAALAVLTIVPLVLMGRSPHVLYRPEELNVRLSDVVGAPVVVDEVVKTLNLFLSHKAFRSQMGGNPRRAVLFEGPPGTGKTYVAKAMAAEAGVPFLFVNSSAFVSMYYGQTNRKIRNYFRELRNYAWREGGAIGFIEEIDAIAMSRVSSGQGRDMASVVNELLIQLQSFDSAPLGLRFRNAWVDVVNRWLPERYTLLKKVVEPANFLVIGATNRASDLDPALMRPGRFDKTIRVDVPSRSGRRDILDYYLARKAHHPEMDDGGRRDALAASTFGYSPVMLEHLLDEALVCALRAGRDRMNWSDVQTARMTEELGLSQPVTYTEAERRAIATHEAGHATVAHFAAPGRRLDVLSIIKRSDALGMLSHSEVEERFTRTKAECEALLRVSMGGLVAEELFFHQASTGPAGDLAAATRLAAQMVGVYGMGGSLVSVMASESPGDLVTKVLSDDKCRERVETILGAARRDTRIILSEHLSVVEALRDALLERDELLGDEILAVVQSASGPKRPVPQVIDVRNSAGGSAPVPQGAPQPLPEPSWWPSS